MNECIETDVLIIGSGIAGCIAALRLADAGIQVVVATRSMNPEESNTFYAQGGIIYKGKEDSPELLMKDIQNAGAGYCNPQAVELLANEGPKLVRSLLLEKLAIPFDRETNGDLSLVLEGGHSVATNTSRGGFYRQPHREIFNTCIEIKFSYYITYRQNCCRFTHARSPFSKSAVRVRSSFLRRRIYS